VWLYHSHVGVDDTYLGLVGTIVVTDPARAKPDRSPDDVDRELAMLFMVWNEGEGEGNQKHAINGRFFGSLDGLQLRVGERVRWYLVALGNEVDLHTAHWHGETVATELGIQTDVIELLPASMRTVDMVPDNPGHWMFHCHVADHMAAGMWAMVQVHR
jgi:FtsP/CotA-like multicopper oxidase with cupredoxin domain